MKIVFLGVGEAMDERLPNCSLWVEAFPGGIRRTVLLDCGFSAAFAYWRSVPDPVDLDAVCLSHFHGDHFLGLPALLLRFHEEGREKGLSVAGQAGVQDKVFAAMDLAYPGLRLKFTFPIVFHEVAAGGRLNLLGLDLAFAASEHPQPNLAVRLSDGGRTLFYSGDGRPTAETLELARGADLVAHESFTLEQDMPGHGTVPGSIAFGREAGAARLALVHLRRTVRHEHRAEVLSLARAAAGIEVIVPEPGDSIEF